MTSRVFFQKRVPPKKSSRQLRKISYANTVIPTEIRTIDKTAIPTDEYRQYQPRGGGMIPKPEKWLVSTWYATLVFSVPFPQNKFQMCFFQYEVRYVVQPAPASGSAFSCCVSIVLILSFVLPHRFFSQHANSRKENHKNDSRGHKMSFDGLTLGKIIFGNTPRKSQAIFLRFISLWARALPEILGKV